MKRVFIFLLCICILAFSVPWAFAVDVYTSTMQEPNWNVYDSPDNEGYKRINVLLNSSSVNYLFVIDFLTNPLFDHLEIRNSSSGLLQFRLYFSDSDYDEVSFHTYLFSVSSGSLLWEGNHHYTDQIGSSGMVYVPSRFIPNSSSLNFNNISNLYFSGVNSTNPQLSVINNVEWSQPNTEPSAPIFGGEHFLEFVPDSSWVDFGRQYVQNPSDHTIFNWPCDFDLFTFNDLTFGRWSSSRFASSVFNCAFVSGMITILKDDFNIFYGNSFELSSNLWTTLDCDFYVIACSLEVGALIKNLLTVEEDSLNRSLEERMDYLVSHRDDLNSSDRLFYDIQKYSVSTLSGRSINPVSLRFTVPSDYADDKICYFFIQTYDAGEHDRIGYTHQWGLSSICLDPFGSSYIPVMEYRNNIQYRNDIIGSDVDGQESGIKGIFKKISQLPGQISGFVSGLGDRLMGSDEEGSESGLKGIVKKIKDLPETLANKIKGLFIPDDDFFEDYKSQFIELFEDHLGVLYQAPEMVISVIRELVSFEPVTGLLPQNYDIKFPAKSFFIEVDSAAEENQFDISEDPFTEDDSEFILLPDSGDGFYHVDLSFLANNPYSTLYSIFRAVTTVVLIISIIYFCIYKFNEILKGAPSE